MSIPDHEMDQAGTPPQGEIPEEVLVRGRTALDEFHERTRAALAESVLKGEIEGGAESQAATGEPLSEIKQALRHRIIDMHTHTSPQELDARRHRAQVVWRAIQQSRKAS